MENETRKLHPKLECMIHVTCEWYATKKNIYIYISIEAIFRIIEKNDMTDQKGRKVEGRRRDNYN